MTLHLSFEGHIKRYLITILLLLPALNIFAENHILASKWEMLQEAKSHKELAYQELLYADEMCICIPDLEKRRHMHVLITTSIGSLPIPEPRAKLLVVGLAIIGSLSSDVFDNFCEWREHICKASYHIEMANFYNLTSLRFNDLFTDNLKKMDNGTKAFMGAIDNLTFAEMMSTCIEEDDVREVVGNYIVNQRAKLIKKFNNPDENIPKNIYEDAYSFSENIYEITADMWDYEFRFSINAYVEAMAEDLELACRYWYGNLQSSNKR